MRLRRLDLLRYGHFTGRSFELPVGALDFHIVFGPNEAGKSTALSAIEDLLFGVPMHSRYNFLHDYSSMRIGAVLESGKESLEVVRRKGSKDTLLGASDLPFPGGESALRPFLAGAKPSASAVQESASVPVTNNSRVHVAKFATLCSAFPAVCLPALARAWQTAALSAIIRV